MNPKIELAYKNRILHVKFLDGAHVDVNDLKEIYEFANISSQGLKYCVLFEALGGYEVTEDAVHYMVDNPNNKYVLAKVYVVNSQEALLKTKLHLRFDKPELLPATFTTTGEGMNYLKTFL